jgi:CubicO group peptidase (beta-lactamase class C family)
MSTHILRYPSITQLFQSVCFACVFIGSVCIGAAQFSQAQTANTANTLRLDADSKSPSATLGSLDWIVGDWKGDALGGTFEESWNAPSGDSMLGMFKLVIRGRSAFSEHMALMVKDGSILLRLKHFDGQLHAWEEKDQTVDFPLVKLSANEAFFSGLTFRKQGNDGLSIFVAHKEADGSVGELAFHAKRVLATPSSPTPTAPNSAPLSSVTDLAATLAEIDQYTQKVQQDWEVPGIAVAIVQGNKLVWSRGYGVREINKPELVDGDTLFAVASNSKAFTAAGLAILVDEGKLNWDDPVTKHLPTFQMPDAWSTREMTVRDLVCHRSGMDTFSGDLLWYDTNYTADQVVDRIRYLKPVSSFRSRYGYQNLMFIAAGKVIEKLSGKNWAEFTQEKILSPLGMQRTTTSVKQIKDNFAAPHNKSFGGQQLRALPLGDVDNSWGACGLNASVNDMSKWMLMQIAGGKWGERQIISAQQLHNMYQPWMVLQQPYDPKKRNNSMKNFQAYGLGYFLADWYGHKVVNHSGGLDGMISQLAIVPSLELGVVVLTNSESSASRFVRDRVLECFMGVQERPDRSAEALTKLAETNQQNAAKREKIDADRKKDTTTTVPLADLAGRFRSDLYGDVEVTVEGDRLVLRMVPAPNFVADLEHWHYNTFQIRWRESVKYNFPRGFANFTINASGNSQQLVIDQPNDDFWFYELDLKRVEIK